MNHLNKKKLVRAFSTSMLTSAVVCTTIFYGTINVSADEITDPLIQILNIEESVSSTVEETIEALNVETGTDEDVALPIALVTDSSEMNDTFYDQVQAANIGPIYVSDGEEETKHIKTLEEAKKEAAESEASEESSTEETTEAETTDESEENTDSDIVNDAIDEDPSTVVQEPDYESFEYCDPYTLYVKNTWVYVRSLAVVDESNILGSLPPLSSITVMGYNTHDKDWVVIDYNGQPGFVYNKNLQESIPESDTYNNNWSGEKLNRRNGIVKGPSGNETYYNLNMKRCVKIMKDKGYNYEVWTRSDGVKMFGNYVMVAADLKIRPKGSLVETTLGTGIVVDTGSFVNWDNTRLDVAVAW